MQVTSMSLNKKHQIKGDNMNHVLEFKQLDQHLLPYVGGKGAALAKLFQMGYPVPSGFIICSTAFEKDLLKPEVTFVIKEHLKRLRKNNHDVSFAIRSSALSEDSELASFAGEFETVLGVKEDDAVFDAITKVYESRKSARVEAYTLAKGIVSDHSMAIVIQVMSDADISGVIFTADPITGNRTHMIGNFIVGMGEQLVAGEATPFQFKYLKEKKLYEGCQESIRVAKKIVKLAIKIEKVMGSPQDIEWCIGNNNIWILQSRPITTLTGYNASTGEWNDSTTGNYLWSNANLSEATPDVMTPLTWSLLKMMHIDTLPFKIPHNYPMIGNIAGRPYINLSLLVSMTHVFEPNVRKTLRKWSDVFGNIPEEIDVPLLPLRFLDIIAMIPDNLKWEIMVKKLYHQLPSFIESNQQWCDETRQFIAQALTQDSLITIWNNTIKPHYMKNCFLLRVVMKRFQEPVFRPRPKLEKHLGIEQASILLSNFSKNASLASLEPLIGLSKLASEKISYDDYINLYGHRGPHEFEISMPGPDENSTWIEEQIASFKRNPVDLTALLNQKRTEYNTSLEQLKQYYPRHYNKILSQIKTITDAAIMREKLRSELVRTYRVIRTFVLKVGEMTQINDGVYFLNID